MVWWRATVVAPLRRAWRLTVARKTGSAGTVDLQRDVQTCGYHDVQVMWDMLSSENRTFGFTPAPAPAPEKQRRRRRTSFWRPVFWHARWLHCAAR